MKREFYLTDAVAVPAPPATRRSPSPASEAEFQGINSRAELAAAEQALQQRLRARRRWRVASPWPIPARSGSSADTKFGTDVTIGPNVRLRPEVTVGSDTVIKAFCDIEGAASAAGALIGPFARIRPGSEVADGVHIGNFVELKATRMGQAAPRPTTWPISAMPTSARAATSAPARSP